MYNPLLCATITQLYVSHWSDKEKGFSPRTLTQIYTYLVVSFLKRQQNKQEASLDTQPLVQCGPVTNITKDIRDKLLALAELAAKGIKTRQYIFDNVSCKSMGFLRKVEGMYVENEYEESHTFLHLTLQEFLAALYWCHKLSSCELEELITRPDLFPIQNFVTEKELDQEEAQSSVTTHWPVLLFIAGIKKFRILPRLEISTKFGSLLQMVHPSLCRLLFECQCVELVAKTLHSGKYVIFQNKFQSKLDWFVAGYCIAHSHSTCLWTLYLNTPDEIKMLSSGVRYTAVTGEGGRIDHLHIKNPSEDIFSLHPHTSQLTKLTLTGSPSDSNFFGRILF